MKPLKVFHFIHVVIHIFWACPPKNWLFEVKNGGKLC